MKECPLDPGGYFIINGSEKVILMQEQMSKNRIIVDGDTKKGMVCSVTSSSAQTKSKTNILLKDGRFFLQHNSFTIDVPIVILIKAMGITSDREILQCVGCEEAIWTKMVPSLKQCIEAKVGDFTLSLHQAIHSLCRYTQRWRHANGSNRSCALHVSALQRLFPSVVNPARI